MSDIKELKGKSGNIIGLVFQTPKEFFDYLEEHVDKCMECENYEYKNNMHEVGTDSSTGINKYICKFCLRNLEN